MRSLALFFICFRCVASQFPFDPAEVPVLLSVGSGSGSGFFLKASNSQYIVTAKHVVFTQDGTNQPVLKAPNAIVKSYSSANGTNTSERILAIDLKDLFARTEVRFDKSHDVAVIRFGDIDPKNAAFSRYLPGVTLVSTGVGGVSQTTDDLSKRFADVEVGSDVFLLGYPVSVTARLASTFDSTRPLLRKGIVAGLNPSSRKILLDCAFTKGTAEVLSLMSNTQASE